jgi:hypothetical protein
MATPKLPIENKMKDLHRFDLMCFFDFVVLCVTYIIQKSKNKIQKNKKSNIKQHTQATKFNNLAEHRESNIKHKNLKAKTNIQQYFLNERKQNNKLKIQKLTNNTKMPSTSKNPKSNIKNRNTKSKTKT